MMQAVNFKMPVKPNTSSEVFSSLSGFYKDLGWNPETHNLDVRRIKISRNNYEKIAEMYTDVFKAEGTEMAMFLVSYMPSVDEGLSDDNVVLYPSWIRKVSGI